MNPGEYLMTWCGRTVPVLVILRRGELIFRVPTGWEYPVSTVPDATWEAIR